MGVARLERSIAGLQPKSPMPLLGLLSLVASCAHGPAADPEPDPVERSILEVPGDVSGPEYFLNPAAPQMNPRRKRTLDTFASGAMNCPPDALSTTFVQSLEVNLHLYDVRGCGAFTSWMLHCMGGVCNWRQVPDALAARELDCHGKDLHRYYAGDGNFIYRGCGQGRTYIHRRHDQWQVFPASVQP